jgi:hypothetical protein
MKLNLLGAFALGAAIGVSGCSTGTQTKPGQPLLMEAAVISTQATIVGIDYKTRVVSLEIPNKPGDNFVDVVVSDDVKNLSQVRFGDRVVVEYLEAVSVDLFRAGEVEPGVGVTAVTGTAAPGARPAAMAGTEKSVVAVIEAIDKANELVALRMPDGAGKTVKVRNPENLDRVSVGDKVLISFTRAWAVSIRPSPVR